MNDNEILLVEDNPDDVELTLRILKKNNLFNNIVVINDGLEALDYLFGSETDGNLEPTEELPQLVLLDLKLPRIDGLELLRRIRLDDRTKLLPVIVLTSSQEEQDRIDSYLLRANSFIRKPVNFNNFLEAVRQLGLYWLILNEQPTG
ncbi:MAG: response regulator [Candidatus Promineifilaceae bacterium]